jgi:hypothetical protein
MHEIKLTDADLAALDAEQGAALLRCQREKQVYHRVVLEQAEQIRHLETRLAAAEAVAEAVRAVGARPPDGAGGGT